MVSRNTSARYSRIFLHIAPSNDAIFVPSVSPQDSSSFERSLTDVALVYIVASIAGLWFTISFDDTLFYIVSSVCNFVANVITFFISSLWQDQLWWFLQHRVSLLRRRRCWGHATGTEGSLQVLYRDFSLPQTKHTISLVVFTLYYLSPSFRDHALLS